MKHFTSFEIDALEQFYKINLINSCTGYKSANLIATESKEKQTNVAVFSSVIHLGSAPALLGFILRPATVPRNTYDNIKTTGFYTINHIHQDIIEDAHHTSAKYPKEISEFDATKLTPEYKNDFMAPFVKDCPVQIGLEYVEEYHIKSNNTILIVGAIKHLFANDAIIQPDGLINLPQAKVAAINGLDSYAVPESLQQFGYQRPKKDILEKHQKTTSSL